jgi:hypothetical protein
MSKIQGMPGALEKVHSRVNGSNHKQTMNKTHLKWQRQSTSKIVITTHQVALVDLQMT